MEWHLASVEGEMAKSFIEINIFYFQADFYFGSSLSDKSKSETAVENHRLTTGPQTSLHLLKQFSSRDEKH